MMKALKLAPPDELWFSPLSSKVICLIKAIKPIIQRDY